MAVLRHLPFGGLLVLLMVSCSGTSSPEHSTNSDGGATGDGGDASTAGTPNIGVLSAGTYHTCVLQHGGSIQCWGAGLRGQLGTGAGVCTDSGGNTYPCSSTTPITVPGIADATAVGAGFEATCALLSSGAVHCWGLNASGQLGDETTGACADEQAWLCSTTPITVSGISNATLLSAGSYHACAILGDGTVQCWGDNLYGDLGDGTRTRSFVPVSVSGITNATLVSAGGGHTCALLGDGTVKCWGYNEGGQLGNTHTGTCVAPGPIVDVTYRCSRTPVTVSDITNATFVTAGRDHSCAILGDGTVKCWGYNSLGQLGDGTTDDSFVPVSVSGITNATIVTAGSLHTCALLTDGTVQCWGDNESGQLGDGTKTDSSTPVSVSGITNAILVSVGGVHTCALLGDGTVQCWGDNENGQLGDGTETDRSTPVTVSGF
jgi:alpha-tubulin suppressor-like RCC1 family protein